ncbi:hypothetical protein KI688_002469 [Linnemannia hyalina]|uniref:Uncharacterized protein n=1 Tax=Linnemannia hyalina TaxID=64524 RepID=A0A9P7XQB6_9FUNG|nr:hypothetical protein KI688_002469 [Linnemannia hyalina]
MTKCKSKESSSARSSSASASAAASASTSDPANKKMASAKEKQEITGAKAAKGEKYQKRTAFEVDDKDVENESEAEGQLGHYRPTKARRIRKDKAEETDDARSILKRKKAARNDAIWRLITSGPVTPSDLSIKTTTTTTKNEVETMGESIIKVAIIDTVTTLAMEVALAAAVSGVDSRVVDEARDAVDQLSIHEGDSENKTGDITDMNISGGQSSDASAAAVAAAAISPRRKTLNVLNDTALEKLWAVTRGKFG